MTFSQDSTSQRTLFAWMPFTQCCQQATRDRPVVDAFGLARYTKWKHDPSVTRVRPDAGRPARRTGLAGGVSVRASEHLPAPSVAYASRWSRTW